MRKIDGRSIATSASIVMLGLVLLALISPSLGSHIPLGFLGVLLSVIPVVTVLALLFYQFGSSKKGSKPQGRRLSLVFAAIATGSIILSVASTVISTHLSAATPDTLKFVFENIGVALLFVAFVCAVLLINGQRFIYWPFWNMSDRRNSDERQRAVRNRVYEKSYRVVVVLLIIAAWLNRAHSQRLRDELFQVVLLCLFGAPAIIAAWQKDS
ncbi:MAG TPA: hypothetical protein VLG16_03565 [Candidatus Saccharimonadales bacterium]|nr:hypothetical protein [Candidatus Saccharimonadales bacterium]